jgi:hypothetical protein
LIRHASTAAAVACVADGLRGGPADAQTTLQKSPVFCRYRPPPAHNRHISAQQIRLSARRRSTLRNVLAQLCLRQRSRADA